MRVGHRLLDRRRRPAHIRGENGPDLDPAALLGGRVAAVVLGGRANAATMLAPSVSGGPPSRWVTCLHLSVGRPPGIDGRRGALSHYEGGLTRGRPER
jgi:hypothetical protein